MVENLIISLTLMFVSGLTFVAYKHPELYDEKFFNKLVFTVIIVILGSQLYDFGVSNAFSVLRKYIDDESLDKAISAKEGVEIPAAVLIGAVALYIYSFFLTWLAHHMKHSVKKKEDSR